MKIVLKINLVLLLLLSLASGIAKVMLAPQELAFFQGAGFSPTLIVAYGASQLVGGILLVFPKTRLFAAIFLSANFLISTVLIFMSGNIGFAIFSLLPVVMADIVVWETLTNRRKNAANEVLPAETGEA